MTSKERTLKAIKKEKLDRLPATPDFSYLFPLRLSGLTTWDVWGPKPSVPIWEIRLEAFKKFELDAWIIAELNPESAVEKEERIIHQDEKQIKVKYIYHTKKGDLTEVMVYPKYDAYWQTEYLIKDLDKDLKKIEELLDYEPKKSLKVEAVKEVVKGVGNYGIVFVFCEVPLNWWFCVRDNTQAILDIHDHFDLLEDLWKKYEEKIIERVKIVCSAGVDLIYTGGSATSLSVISPLWYEKYVYPSLKRITDTAHSLGTMVCAQVNGRCNKILEFVKQAGCDCIEPLEKPPLGDVDIGEAKTRIGKRVCLKGNVDPVNTLLKGSPKDVENEISEIINKAGEGGGFIVSTGDQVPRDTPFENIKAFKDAVEKYGKQEG